MKNSIKNIAAFIFFGLAASGFIACSSSSSADSNNSVTKNNDFPPAPAAIMQADIKDVDGKTFKLEDKKGKPILVNLWATWCGPCRAEMPTLVAMQDEYRDKGFEIVGLDSDTDETPEQVKAFAQTMKLNYQLGYAEPKLMNDFLKISKNGGIPQSFLIDREGKLRGVFFGVNAKVVNELKDSVAKVVNE